MVGDLMTWSALLKESSKVVAATLLFFAVAELLLRAGYLIRNSMVDYVVLPYNAAQDFGPVPPWMDALRILERDAALSWRSRPNVRQRYMDVYSPVRVESDRTKLLRSFIPRIPAALRHNPVWEVSINSAGFRGREFPSRKEASSFRILCLGDSWTFGANVDQEDVYPERLSGLLNHKFPNVDFEVFNLGVLGYSSYQGLELLRRTALDLLPDLLLIGFGMNDAIVGGWRDKDFLGQQAPEAKFTRILEHSEAYKLLRYVAQILRHEPWSIGDYMQEVAASAGTEGEAWIGGAANESADYEKLEAYTRVSPRDYERNILEMIRLARSRGVGVILLYNQVWDSPYRIVLESISAAEGVPLVTSKAVIDRARTRIERDLEERLKLRPSEATLKNGDGEIEVIFRVYLGDRSVPESVYLAGAHAKLGGGVPNRVAMYDDGTHGDQRPGDHVWSYASRFSPGTRLFYVYTNSGAEGRWEGLDVPEVRRFTVAASDGATRSYRPIESFGEMYMQADGWHTNAAGYALIAEAVLETVRSHEQVVRHLKRVGDP